MEYLDLLQSLSSNDPFLQITGITRITAAIKSQPSPIFVNTVAINMAVEFSKSSNYVRHFITQFFQQCSTEMCMIKSKIDIFRHLTSILDVNDPVAQCNMLKILMYLAPLLADFLEIHHKILLALESPHRKVRETASEILPKVISYAPSIARHVFEKPISKFSVKKLISVLPDDEETMKKAYAYIVSTFQKSEMMEYLCYLAIRSPRLIKHVTEILKKYNETGYLKELSKFYRKDMIFGSDNTVNLPARNQHVEIEIKLKSEKLNEKDYKEIFKNWDKACQYEWIADRLEIMVANNSKEIHMCLKLAKLVKIPQIYLENILSKHIMDSQILLQLTYILIRSNSLDSISHITHKLDNYQLYLLACEFMTFGCHSKSLEIFVKLKTEFKGSNEKSYEWLCTLTIISEFESRKDKKVDGFAALSHLGCLDLGHKIYFQSEFLLCRLLLVHYLKLLQNPSMETSALTVEFVKLRSRFHKLLYLFAKTSQSTSQCLKK